MSSEAEETSSSANSSKFRNAVFIFAVKNKNILDYIPHRDA